MPLFLRNNLKLINLARLRIFSRNVHQCCNYRSLANPFTGLISSHKSLATVAHNYKSSHDFGNFKENSESEHLSTLNDNAAEDIDTILMEIDEAVRRTGRSSLKSLNRILEIVENAGSVTEMQSLYLLRCCSLLRRESPTKRVELANKMWNKLNSLGIQYDVKHYNALLKVYLDCSHNFSSSEILISMEQNHIEPNQKTFCYLIEKYCKDGNINGANEILEHMKEKGISVNEAVFNSLVKGHIKISDVEGAKEIMEVMRTSNIPPTPNTYTILACGFAENGNFKKLEEILLEAESNRIFLDNNNLLQIILSLPSADHAEFVDKILKNMENIEAWRQDFFNTAAELIHKDLDDIAYKLILAISTPGNGASTNLFMKVLIEAEKPSEKIVQYCKDIYDKGLNSYIFINAARASVKSGKFDCAISFFEEMRKRGIPVRSHNFSEIFLAYKHSSEDIWKTLRKMSDLGLLADFYTYIDHIFPAMSSMHPDDVFFKIQECGQSVNASVDPLFQHYCSIGEIDHALYLIKKHNVRVNAEFSLEQYLSHYKHFSSDPSTYFMVLKYIMENSGLPGQDKSVIRGKKLASFIQTDPNLFEEFCRSGSGKSCEYSRGSLQVCRNILRVNSPDLLKYLRKLQNVHFNTAIKGITVEEEERILNSTTTENHSKRAMMMDLLSLHIRGKDIERLNRVKSEFDSLGFIASPSIHAQLFTLYCEIGNVDAAQGTLKKLKEAFPTYDLDSAKFFDYCRMLVKFSKFDEAIEVIKNECKVMNNFSRREILLNSLRRFLESSVQTGNIDFVKAVQDSLMVHAEPLQLMQLLLEPLIKIYLFRNDFENSVKEFSNCVVKYHCSPCLNLLLRKLIFAEEEDKLQTIIDLASKTEGSIKVLHKLAFVLIDLGKIQQAMKVMKNIGHKVDYGYLEETCQQMCSQNRVTEVESLLHVTEFLKHHKRDNMYCQLFKLHAEKNNYEKATQLLQMMKKENLEPSEEIKQILNKLYLRNNQPAPFDNDLTDIDKIVPDLTLTDATLNFRNFLNDGDAIQVLKELENMKKGHIRTLPLQDVSRLVDLLVEKNGLNDLALNVSAMSYIIDNSLEVFKPLLEKYSQDGNVQAMMSLSNIFPDFALKKSFFNSFFGKAYIASNRPEDLLSEYENYCDKKNKLYSNSGFEEIVRIPHLQDRALNLAKRYLEMNIDVPLSVIWAHYFTSENYNKANEISQNYTVAVDKVDNSVLRSIRQNENISLGKKYIEFIDKVHPKDRSKERAYGTLLDVFVLKQMYDEAVDLVMAAKSKKIDLEKHYTSTLTTLKSCLERENKPVPFSCSNEVR